MDQVKDTTIENATCECGKLLADCQCARGEACECGGDPALCHSNKEATPQVISVSLSSPFSRK